MNFIKSFNKRLEEDQEFRQSVERFRYEIKIIEEFRDWINKNNPAELKDIYINDLLFCMGYDEKSLKLLENKDYHNAILRAIEIIKEEKIGKNGFEWK